jgi:hypothetical protein
MRIHIATFDAPGLGHLIHDRGERQRRRILTLRMRKACGDLFLGPHARW